MNTTVFQNEHLLPGQIGQFFVILSFAAAIVAALAYFFATQSKLDMAKAQSWKTMGRSAFYVHAISVFSIFGILFYLIFNHYFEYHYVWAHSSKSLPFKYLLSCFWEGQEGSFLLWSIWHCVLSLFVMRNNNTWEPPVMAVVSVVQIFLSSMLLGIHFGDVGIGTTPFELLRDHMAGAPIFARPDYLTMIEDGNGLNPLLQNYWMVIHPPILFLGFAATLYPFAYAIAGLWQKQYDTLLQPLLRWSLLSGMVLGTGIMMGGAWAYESLNFGGYWAWDPVENASLVPWIVMLAGLHTTMIYKATGYSMKSTLLFFIFSFILVLYSTFLTRTGMLGDTSVHAFTGEGDSLKIHLLVFMFGLLLPALALFTVRFNSIPDVKKEEEALSSREFWMFIGSLILMISVVQITYTTSMPVWNKLFGTALTVTDPITHYNKIQLWITLLILLLTAFVYYLKFKKSDWRDVIKKIAIPLTLAAVTAGIIIYTQSLVAWPIAILMLGAWLAFYANLFYLITVIKGKVIKWGGTMAHLGFALMIVGIILSGYNKEVISINRLGVDFNMGKETAAENKKESRENVLLFRNVPVTMGGYTLTYMGDTVAEPNHYYRVQYQKFEGDTGKVIEQFVLEPNAQINPKMGLISSPDTRHYWTHDVFTYVTSTVDKAKQGDTSAFTSKQVKPGDSIFFSRGFMVFRGFSTDSLAPSYQAQTGDIAVAANLDVYDLHGTELKARPTYIVRQQQEVFCLDTVSTFNLYTRLSKIIPSSNAAVVEYKQPNAMEDYIIMKAMIFPYINLLWLGTIIMILGFFMSLLKRIRTK